MGWTIIYVVAGLAIFLVLARIVQLAAIRHRWNHPRKRCPHCKQKMSITHYPNHGPLFQIIAECKNELCYSNQAAPPLEL